MSNNYVGIKMENNDFIVVILMIIWLFICLRFLQLNFGDCCGAGMAEAGRERNSGKCQRPKVASP